MMIMVAKFEYFIIVSFIVNVFILNVYSSCPSVFNEILLQNLTNEINEYDRILGHWLYRYQTNQWQRLMGQQQQQLAVGKNHHELMMDDQQPFISDFIQWSYDRYSIHCNSMANNEKSNSFHHCPMNKLCRYWSEVQRLFGQQMNDDHLQQLIFNHQKEVLTKHIEQIEIQHRNHRYRCDESIDLIMQQIDDPNELFSIWYKCHHQLARSPIPELFEKIQIKISDGEYFHGKFNTHTHTDTDILI